MIVYVLTGVTLLIVLLVMWRIAAATLRRFDGSYEPAHKTPRLLTRSAAGAARAGRRVSGGARRLPGAVRRRLRRDLGAEDRITLGLMQRMRAEDASGLAYGIAPAPASVITWADGRPTECPDCGGYIASEETCCPDCGYGVDYEPAPPPVIHHDEYRPKQRWHEPVERVHLRHVTQPAITALALALAPVAAHLNAIERARAEEWDAYVRETRPWAEDTGSFAAICADVMGGA